ncbi:AfsR/SARP family transcriptional regulator [Amycolatopsis suaedae]|uniref:AfsR/SARP family transcriptional regulator n=1 Tax=Amycolatopsis suaedae TaxID=2510978 RepID=UPI0013EEEEB3|nr:AfsR/SARP family transcriptional regulator [Amycolatopsis suaedae]
MTFRVLGPLEVHDPAGRPVELGTGKSVTLLSALLRHANRWVSIEQLISTIWHEQAVPASAVRNLKTYVWRLRRTLGAARIDSRAGAYRIRLARGELDSDRARALLAAAGHVPPAEAAGLLTEAAELWRGRPYAELPESMVADLVTELDQLRWQVRERLAAALTAAGHHDEAAALLRELTTQDPLREGPQARLVLALHHAGRRAEALEAFRRARAELVTELGVEPGPELAAAHRAVLGAAPQLPAPAPHFTGRQAELARVAALLRAGRVLSVDGVRGVGKTALAVRAAHDLAAGFPDGRVLLNLRGHDVRGPLPVAEALARLLRAVGADVPADPAGRAAAWAAALAGRRVLVVLDDAACAAQVRPLLPAAGPAAALVTGSHPLPGLPALTLRPLPDRDAWRLLRAEVGAVAETEAAAAALRRCEGLPAAIRAASTLLLNGLLWTEGRLVTAGTYGSAA